MLKQDEFKSWSEKLAASCRQDPKKAAMLAALAVVLLTMWGRLLVTGDTQPARAAASNASGVGAPKSATPQVTPAANRNAGFTASAQALASQARPNDTRRRLREWLAAPVHPIARNLFTVKLEYFPRDGSRPSLGVKTARDGEFWGRLEKSLLLQADQRDKRDNLLANFKDDARKLRLDSIVMGPQPKAMIDGKLLSEGEVVAAFRVLKIEPRRIIVEREGIRLEIQMK